MAYRGMMAVDLPDEFADSWRPVTTLTDERSVFVLSIAAETTVYGPASVTDPAVVDADLPLRSLFVVDLTVSPPLPTVGVTPTGVLSMAAVQAKNRFVDAVEAEGLIVDGVRNTLAFESPSGSPGKWYVLDAAYPLAPDRGDGLERIAAEAHVVVWPTETSFGVVGGTHPLETAPFEGPSPDSDVGTDSSPVGLEVDPERDRERIARLARAIDASSNDSPDGG